MCYYLNIITDWLCVILQGELLSKIREQILLCDQVIKSVSENCYNKLEHCSTIFYEYPFNQLIVDSGRDTK